MLTFLLMFDFSPAVLIMPPVFLQLSDFINPRPFRSRPMTD
jgi:hypothetical protein